MMRVLLATAVAVGVIAGARAAGAAPVKFPEAPAPGLASFSGSRVRTLLIVGDTIYAGGNFRVTENGVTRTNLAAFDLQGNLKPEFEAAPNGTVFALATDGTSLFVAGEFTRLELKSHVAAIDLVTGEIKRSFTTHVYGAMDTGTTTGVRALAVLNDTSVTPPRVRLIIGGNFTRVNSTTDNRNGLAAVQVDTGDLDATSFTQGAVNGFIDSLLATNDTVYVGASYRTDNQGQSLAPGPIQIAGRQTTLVALNKTGGLLSGNFNSSGQPIMDLDVDLANNRLFAAIGGIGNRPMAFTATGSRRGSVLWNGPRVGGDTQSVHAYGGNVFFGFHDGMFEQPDIYKFAAVDAATGKQAVDSDHADQQCSGAADQVENCWLPQMDKTDGAQGFFGCWAVTHFINPTTNLPTLVVGGEFTQISGVTSARRFAMFPEPAPPPPPPPEDPPPADTSGAPGDTSGTGGTTAPAPQI